MEVKVWGEDRLIKYMQQQFITSPSLVGIGDDCAVIPNGANNALLVTTDALVEGTHFIKDLISPENLGYKTIAVNISDIGAMGGIPNYAFLSMAIPGNTETAWLKLYIQGIKSACNEFDINFLGGDTVGSKRDLFFNVTMIGSADINRIKYRHMAKPGDVVCVTGFLGDSSAGLQAFMKNIKPSNNIESCIQQQQHPEIHHRQGYWLGAYEVVHAMIDLSDGLDRDLKHILLSSNCAATIELSHIPISKALQEICHELHWDSFKFALFGGEDYRLLLTIASEAFSSIQHAFRKAFNSDLYKIGCITEAPIGHIQYCQCGKPIELHYSSYNHFD